ncbi:type IVB secretion system protein IcmW [Idiomarina abyssalis]|uniref:Uncharacterized protein n=1 Tax=Idiomarina abyssalis TaxID=86102 RepID=A0A8I1G6N5_9GAMM|nr:hypothetical protein [Idiomarina abyssalis]MBJ7265562.1 hypothetical protein [Idiomarina abyssalis]MBJ7316764.1 hypothetical protein [Idiomarina abyssalis]
MFDNRSRDSFINSLSEPLKRVIETIGSREPWAFRNDPSVEELIDWVGRQLQSFANMEKLAALETKELAMLFSGLSIERYLTALERLSASDDHIHDILLRAHNDIDPTDLDTSKFQRILMSRLQTLIKARVIERTYSEENTRRVNELLGAKQ